MDTTQLSEVADELKYILAKINKYLKNNHYVYLRAFDSWKDGYNGIATKLNSDKTITVPTFKLGPFDYSPSGKSIKKESVNKLVKTINHQVIRLEEKALELNRKSEEEQNSRHSLERFFHHDSEGHPIEPPRADKRVFIAIPDGETDLKLFWQGIQPALETLGLSFFRADHPELDDTNLAELCQELHSCRLAIFNLSRPAPNVMLALGLAYGIGKPTIILQPQHGKPLGELVSDKHLRYSGASDIKAGLTAILPQFMQS